MEVGRQMEQVTPVGVCASLKYSIGKCWKYLFSSETMIHSMWSVLISAVLNHFWIRWNTCCVYEPKPWNKSWQSAQKTHIRKCSPAPLVSFTTQSRLIPLWKKRDAHALSQSVCTPAECYLHLLCIPEYMHLCSVLWLTILFSLFFFKETRQLSTRGAVIKNESIF